ncbi:hypothetical protein EBL85_11545 [Marichromatium sp. AB32]|nr:hypothetical protein [Marichromatium sp.]RNE92549.1 hypothetical protein EBL85_11545 [Marichromatium sp. AB32]
MQLANRRPLAARLILMLLAMAILVLGYQWGNQYQRRHAEPPTISGVLLRPPLAAPEFALEDALGRPFDRARLGADWTLLAFGSLADASGQRALQRLIETRNRLADRPEIAGALRLVLIDGGADRARARDFSRLSPALDIVSGPPEARAPLAALGDDTDAGSTPILVFAPGARLLAILPGTAAGATLAADLAALHAAAPALLAETP